MCDFRCTYLMETPQLLNVGGFFNISGIPNVLHTFVKKMELETLTVILSKTVSHFQGHNASGLDFFLHCLNEVNKSLLI